MTGTLLLPYYPGAIPTRPAPIPGEVLVVELAGLPPHKDRNRSIRNPKHPRYQSFVDLRRAAAREMNGRAWYRGTVGLALEIRTRDPELRHSVIDYAGGIMDTLDGSHGTSFTYLPIVFEDDAQVAIMKCIVGAAEVTSYRLELRFLKARPTGGFAVQGDVRRPSR